MTDVRNLPPFDDALAVLRRQGWHLVADILAGDSVPTTIIVGGDFRRQVAEIAARVEAS